MILQSNEVGGANYMELEGLQRCLNLVDENKVVHSTLVTDRHGPIRKFMRTYKQEIKHFFDVFHVAKCKLLITKKGYTMFSE